MTSSGTVTALALVSTVPRHEVTAILLGSPEVKDLLLRMEVAAVSTKKRILDLTPDTVTSITGRRSQAPRGTSSACASRAEPTMKRRMKLRERRCNMGALRETPFSMAQKRTFV